ncbi:MAG: hypothetical protein CM15mP104_2500 [Gammaproteobacteria bacterium]|nr:MAG: hypothetical protein CM15mP104_2500 [Gammaproteobacteria bacterium]
MKEAVMKVMEGYVTAYKNNDKELFLSLWDEAAIFEDPVGAEPCKGIDSISAFWDFGHSNGMNITPVNEEFVVCANEGILKAKKCKFVMIMIILEWILVLSIISKSK